MKKIVRTTLSLTAAAALSLAAAGCASTGATGSGSGAARSAGSTPFTITDDSGVVGYYTFDEDSIEDNEIIDHSGYGQNVYSSALDGSKLTKGKNGNALDFTSGDEFITLESDVLEGEGLTVAAWVKPSNWKVWARIFDFGNAKPGQDIFLCDDGRSANLMGLNIEGGTVVRCPLPMPGKWTHVAATLGNGKLALYINGKLTQEEDTESTIADIAADAQGIYIGRSNWLPDPLFEGAMDEILVANRGFSAAEIQAVYNGVIAPDAE